MEPIRVALIDDHQLVRDGIKSLIHSGGNMMVVVEASSPELFFAELEKAQPEVVLMDISMPGMSGIEATQIISQKFPTIKVIILSMFTSEEFIQKAIVAGAKGYLPKNTSKQELLEAITKVYNGEEYYGKEIAEVLLSNLVKKAKTEKTELPEDKLSKRELEILLLVAKGMTNSHIADKLFISVKTVEAHKAHIMQKMQLTSHIDLIKMAIQLLSRNESTN
ncbi:MAG TPA: response regulator transcription factor [Williamwhitmania sp.]|nr:response regulator transcription factor [Williamwhitmania sp.]